MGYHKQPDAVRPVTGAIGKREDGEFATSRLKEYPVLFGRALARVISDRLLEAMRESKTHRVSLPADPVMNSWLEDPIAISLQESRTLRFLPDFQG